MRRQDIPAGSLPGAPWQWEDEGGELRIYREGEDEQLMLW